MATREELSISITAELGDLRKQLKEVGNIGDDEIRDMVKGIQKSLKEAEKSADKAAGKQKAIGAAAKNSAEAAKKAASMLGGSFAQAGDAIFELVPKLGSVVGALGPIGVAATAASAAVLAVGAGALVAINHLAGLADAGLTARDSLQKLWAEASPEENLRKLQEFKAPLNELAQYEAALKAIEQAHSEAAVKAGAAQTSLSLGWRQFKDSAWDSITNGLSAAADSFARTVAPGFVRGLEDMGQSLKDATGEAEKFRQSLLDAQAAADDAALAQQRARNALLHPVAETEEEKKLREAREKAAAERAKAAEEEKRNELRIAKEIAEGKYQILLESFAKDAKLYEEEQAKIEAGEDSWRQRQLDKTAEIESRKTELVKDEVAKQLAAYADAEEKSKETAELTQELFSRFAESAASAYKALIDQSTEYTIRSYETRLAAGETFTQEETKAYEEAIKKRRVAAVAEILINAAISYTALVAKLVPSQGSGAFVTAAALVGLEMIAPLSAVIGQNIPWSVGSGEPVSADTDFNVYDQGSDTGNLVPLDPYAGGTLMRSGATERSGAQTGAVVVTLDRRLMQLRIVSDVPGKSTRGKI